MNKVRIFIAGLMLIGMVGCDKSNEIQSAAYDDVVNADYRSATEADSIFSRDSGYFLGTIFFDEQTEEHVIAEDFGSINAYLESYYGEDFALDSLNVVSNYLYLHFSHLSEEEGHVVYAEDVIISGGEWVHSSLITGGGVRHKCDGGCASTVIDYCSSCDFERDEDGKITGCKCNNTPGFCCHTIEASMDPGPGPGDDSDK